MRRPGLQELLAADQEDAHLLSLGIPLEAHLLELLELRIEVRRALFVARDLAELLGALGEAFDLAPAVEPRGAAPAELWRVAPGEGHPGGELGVIASVTHPFCGACDRTRLTSDGQIRSCLFSQEESDLRAILRGGGSDDDLAAAWAAAQWGKPRAHGIDDAGFVQPARTMSAIGG
ncbi:MAG TPA: hypothetical protein PJ992_11865 [Arachnia sp.]|nr:hypothetical protein [Arachnia sp.]